MAPDVGSCANQERFVHMPSCASRPFVVQLGTQYIETFTVSALKLCSQCGLLTMLSTSTSGSSQA